MACLFIILLLGAPVLGFCLCVCLTASRRTRALSGSLCRACDYDRRATDPAAPCPECGLTVENAAKSLDRHPILPALIWLPVGLLAFTLCETLTIPHSGETLYMLLAYIAPPLAIAFMLGIPRFGRSVRLLWLISMLTGMSTTAISAISLIRMARYPMTSEYGPGFAYMMHGLGTFLAGVGAVGWIAATVAGTALIMDRATRKREPASSPANVDARANGFD